MSSRPDVRRWVPALPYVFLGAAAVMTGWHVPYSSQFAIGMALLGIVIGIWLVVAGLRRPMAGVEILVVVAVLIPLEVTERVNASLAIAAGLVSLWFLRQVVLRRQLLFARSAAVVATLALMAVTMLAFVAGQFPWFPVPPAPMPAQLGGMALFLASTGILLVVAGMASRRDLQRLMWLFVGAGAAIVFATAAGLSEIRVNGLTISTSASIGSVFYTWLVALSAGQALWNPRLSMSWRVALIGLAILVVLHELLVLFTWASSWLPSLIALGAILLMRFPRLTIAGGLALLPLVLFDWSPAVDPIMANESYSWDTRIAAAAAMRDLIAYSPVIGFGPANYHFYTPLFPILGYRVMFNSHNNYIDVAAQTGVVGLAVFVTLLLAILWTAFRLAQRFAGGFEKAYLMGAIGGVIGTACSGMLGDWIIPFVYNVGARGFRSSVLFWLFAGGVLAIDRILRERRGAGGPFAAPVPIHHRVPRTPHRL